MGCLGCRKVDAADGRAKVIYPQDIGMGGVEKE